MTGDTGEVAEVLGLLRPQDLIDAAEVRRLAKIKSRATLIAWRRDRGFPNPIATLSSGVDIYDRRAVKHWLKNNR